MVKNLKDKKGGCHRRASLLSPVLFFPSAVPSSLCPWCTGMRKEGFQSGGNDAAFTFGRV